jgi:hypothetical protein
MRRAGDERRWRHVELWAGHAEHEGDPLRADRDGRV